jgi:transcriptional regulator with XRE-family HTH domain
MTINISDHSPASDRDCREQLGITAENLSARAGISTQELMSYEHAKSETDANPMVAMKIADALDAFEREIIEDGDNEPKV